MAIRLHIPRKAVLVRLLMHPAGKILIALVTLAGSLGLLTFTYYYVKFARLIDQKLEGGPYQHTAMIFAAPRVISLGEEIAPVDIVEQLQTSGYTESRRNPLGWYHLRQDAVEVFPGPDSYFDPEAGVIRFSDGRVSQIISTRDNTERTQYLLEPELITNLFDKNREKRRLVKYGDIPELLVRAVISVEDKRFFQHAGFDPIRIMKSVYVDLKEARKAEGASTLSMQLARILWLDRQKTWRRKAAEGMITLHLERKLTKEQIFEYYANHIDLGRRGSFAIRGFGEAAQAYFDKDIKDLTLAEAATLAGLAQRPSYTNPLRWPERARVRRNVVLSLMRENGYITARQYAEAAASPLDVVRGVGSSADAPYFVDLVNEELQEKFQDHDFQGSSYRIYTTLDLDLQRAAAEAVRTGLEEVDPVIARRRKIRKAEIPDPQVALVALDAQTGEVKALIGGRNYGVSQLNRARAKRQPGSAFKPFVFAAAFESALSGSAKPLNPLSTVVDEPTTFWFDDKPYEPGNYKDEYRGVVTLRTALSKSINVPTVKVAEMAGYDRVVDVAVRAGMNLRIQPTPAVALGAYEVTPIEVAGAYTVFPGNGMYSKPNWIKLIRDDGGKIIYQSKAERHEALDPRVSYLITDMMEEVLRSGTGAGVRSRGFVLHAAGKTGTSHDAWFAGFTSKLICVVWVGFDDNRELNIEGARAALPIWTEFMKRAHELREYRGVEPFRPPDGIVMVEIDPETGTLATVNCPKSQAQAFVAGTQPVEACRLHGGVLASATQVTGWEAAPEERVLAVRRRPASAGSEPSLAAAASGAASPPAEKPRAKKGFFRRLLDVFK